MLLCRSSLSCIGAWVTANRPCPALLFASLLLSYHVFLALTSIFLRKIISADKQQTPPSRCACQLPFQGSLFVCKLHSTSIRSGRNFSCPYSSRIRLKLCISCTDPYPHWLLGYSISDRRRQPRMRYARI